jgi:hypothetical protein
MVFYSNVIKTGGEPRVALIANRALTARVTSRHQESGRFGAVSGRSGMPLGRCLRLGDDPSDNDDGWAR